jgi:hypothetical protein
MSLRRPCFALVGAVALLGLSACGTADNSVAIRVGDATITKAAVAHWTSVARRNGALPVLLRDQTKTLRERALLSLILADWLIGEAKRMEMPIRAKAINAAFAERMRGFGGVEFRKTLKAGGETSADVKFELAAEMALEAIDEKLAGRAKQFTQSDLARFYREDRIRFAKVPETRVVDIVEYLPSAAAATALVRRVGTGRAFTARAARKWIQLTPGTLAGPPTKKAVDRAIFSARPGVVSRPMSFNGGWTVFVVRKITPVQRYPFANVRSWIATSFMKYRKREMEGAFEAEFRRRWTAKTTCGRGYVVPGCAEYHGPPGDHEDPFSVNPLP